MKKRDLILIPSIIAAFVLGIGTSSLIAGRHPQIKAAEELLVKAQEHLMRAGSEFGGHKVRAMEHIKAAVVELQEARQFDR